MTSKYADLVNIAVGNRTICTRFEAHAGNKLNELYNELITFLGMPRDRIVRIDLKPHGEEHAAPGATVITSHGLKFGFRVHVDVVFVNFVSTICPAGDRLLVGTTEDETIDVTDREGILRWCEWMEGYIRDGVAG